MKNTFHISLGMTIQIIAMLTDIFLVGVPLALWYYKYISGFLLFVILVAVYFSSKSTGGLFYAWRPSSMRLFYRNWKNLNG